MTIDRNDVLLPSAEIVCRQVGRESILVPASHDVRDADFVYSLSTVATRIWTLLDGTRTVEAVALALCEEFDTDAETATADATALLEELERAKLVVRRSVER